MFDINPTAPSPIWMQIEEGIRRMISLGAFKPGDSVPSVRDLARTLRVNPNTVARVYQRLTEGGVLVVRRGEGTYVSDAPSQPNKSEKHEKLRDAAISYAGTALAVGATLHEASAELEQGFDRLSRDHRRKA